ncbi:MAG: ABC transporter ATP-binding protein [Pirellulaceae bacterium]|nr:ABC transporter ATP-binding protein [Pirellulaceae bacterium]
MNVSSPCGSPPASQIPFDVDTMIPMQTLPPAIDIQCLTHHYGQRLALNELNLQVARGQIFALLGPNGSGKSTLFRILSTVMPFENGRAGVLGYDVRQQAMTVRQHLGVVFQSPSLDRKLTVRENLRCQAALYGVRGAELTSKLEQLCNQFGLQHRLADRVDTLSGGLQRRVELAKALLHRPQLLLMDEPSTGLDPAARLDLWHLLRRLQSENNMTVAITTHLLDEADKADSIAILDRGVNVASGRPDQLRSQLGAQVLSITTVNPQPMLDWLAQQSVEARQSGREIRVSGTGVAQLVAPLSQRFPEDLQSLTIGKPSLEDVFIARTGHRFNGSVGWDVAGDKHPESIRI